MTPHHPTSSTFHCYPLPIHHLFLPLKILIIVFPFLGVYPQERCFLQLSTNLRTTNSINPIETSFTMFCNDRSDSISTFVIRLGIYRNRMTDELGGKSMMHSNHTFIFTKHFCLGDQKHSQFYLITTQTHTDNMLNMEANRIIITFCPN